MHVLAPAKINLHLRVGPRRADGFHPLLSWMCTVGLFDTLTFNPSTGRKGSELALRCDNPDLPCGAENLVCKSAAALAAACAEPLAIDCLLQKSIPSGAGLGGGSSDAARTLLALNRLHNANLPFIKLSQLAAAIGSDVPFFLHEPSAICQGRGEKVEKILSPRAKWVLLILPPIHCPTPQVYRQFDEMKLGDESAITEFPNWQQWTQMPALELLSHLINDLEPPAFFLFPPLQQLQQQCQQLLNRPVRMSGSGSSLFTLYDTSPESAAACEILKSALPEKILSVPLCPSLSDDLAA